MAAVSRGEPDRLQVAPDLVGRQVGAEDGVDPGRAHGHGDRLREVGGVGGVDQAADHLGPGDLGEELGEAGRGPVDALGVDSPLEAHRRLRAQAEALRGAGDGLGPEPGRLQEDGGGGVGDLRRGATHDPAHPDGRALGVADQAVVGPHPPLDLVEGDEGLLRPSPPHEQPPAREAVEVVGVVGLAQLEHHVVGDVDHVADGAHAGHGQPSRQPGGRRAHGDPLNDDAGEAGREVGSVHHDRGRRGPVVGRQRGRLGQGEREPVVGGQVAGHARHREGVGPVGGDVEVEHGVGTDAEGLGEGHARLGALRLDDEDPGVVVGQLQLRWGAEHPLRPLAPHLAAGDLHAVGQAGADGGQGNQVAGAEVERPAHDLAVGAAVARVHLHQLHLVGVGVDGGGDHPGHDHPVEPLPHPLHALHDQPQAGEGAGQLVHVVAEGREVTQPGKGNLHSTPVSCIGSAPRRAPTDDFGALRVHQSRRGIRTARGSGCRC